MIKHYIIMSSSYTDGSRVALDITEDCFLNSKAIAEMIEEIRKNCGKDVPLSTHFIETESASWDSVVAYVFWCKQTDMFIVPQTTNTDMKQF